ncbi:MarR family transcriptional regulator [Mammaliicoccus vitulinus]|uniref:MarR family transcriptional regulator n=1 Tax=Mammaliicoccus vitulinus TaxID=71237 RepID=A0ABX7HI43_9STAP|nr:MarR family transcriptional regulator [Mammaliicoccus vitulinus]MBO3078360.1 MarR family transcriptional regulator [Mammaliicoccus vitulinus]MEB7657805.1 MarR family transcriptional regulator [Mammaliicoccus vitulinus]PNZ41273.1 MarR family transcriptional regulator [Mammaliicoccus vitulinus]QRO85624.1 MarR family transcriptional regulator [Mammaliicoccus vitulinus]
MISNSELQDLDLFDLLSERHGIVRTKIEDMWNNTHDIYISSSEWYIMAKIFKHNRNMAYITKSVNISRQAVHKFVKQLNKKGLVDIQDVEGNKKEKSIQLTELGEACFLESKKHKQMIEQQLIETIGSDNVDKMREILKMDWDIENQ